MLGMKQILPTPYPYLQKSEIEGICLFRELLSLKKPLNKAKFYPRAAFFYSFKKPIDDFYI